jgi:Na+/melibiose symporter-like transporter
MIATCLAFTSVPLLSSGDFIGFAAICLITGAGLGVDLGGRRIIKKDVADWDRARFRVRRTGILFSFWNMSTKLSLALAVGVAFPLLEWAGLNNSDGATDFSQYVLVVIYAVIPIVLKIVAVALMWKFPIGNKQHQAIERKLKILPIHRRNSICLPILKDRRRRGVWSKIDLVKSAANSKLQSKAPSKETR